MQQQPQPCFFVARSTGFIWQQRVRFFVADEKKGHRGVSSEVFFNSRNRPLGAISTRTGIKTDAGRPAVTTSSETLNRAPPVLTLRTGKACLLRALGTDCDTTGIQPR